ncbi:TonB-dependent receptor plug domain-containing protein [Kangiella shandongensis]|uniref:TonB-dependent receptor plug domain-containing protein n=1 Tax=Kangiella shandongensis TaxID=2763258 RepID=UPI001CC0E3F3|nr:TonB-dependent receptor [Kangiella shandongensis]
MVSRIACAVFIALSGNVVWAEEPEDSADVIVVRAERVGEDLHLAEADPVSADVASWLKSVPGANVNRNGPVTGIAQYRGMFGDRISKSIGGRTIIGAGPNAMDAPLSYAVPVSIEAMTVYRGIAPVTAGIDTIGGAVDVQRQQAAVSDSFMVDGSLISHYASNNDAEHYAGDINFGLKDFGAYLYGSQQSAKNYEDAQGNEVVTSAYERELFGADMAYDFGAHRVGLSWNQVNTKHSGTLALPMDINFIDSDDWSLYGSHQLDGAELEWRFGVMENEHGMDNFSQRLNPMPEMHRYTFAGGSSRDYHLVYRVGDWSLGVDGVLAEHDADITNPNNPMFVVSNFNQVQDDRHSAFVQWSQSFNAIEHTIGARVKYNQADAGEVYSSMAMMMPAVQGLQNDFNRADKSVNELTYDVTYHGTYALSDSFSWNYSAAVKQKAASYQQRYLWVPMQATGGLADGKTYVGDINLDPETAYQLEAGFNYQQGGFSASPRVFYYDIADYIEANPSADPRVVMAAQMMGDLAPLQFSNVDATLWGLDANWQYQFASDWYLAGNISYVRGERDDIDDNLYRIAPLNTRFTWGYDNGVWSSRFDAMIYASQNRASNINEEQRTPGYMIWNWYADYCFNSGVLIKAGIENIFDKEYREHLGGVNRARGSDIAVGERLPGLGQNLYVGVEYRF